MKRLRGFFNEADPFLCIFQAYFLFHLPHLTPLMDTLVYLNLSFDNLLFFPVEVCAAYIP